MSVELVLLVAVVLLLVATVLGWPILAARLELRRVARSHELSDEELASYQRELPEVCHAVAESLGSDASAREIRQRASESVLMAILRERYRRARSAPPRARAGTAGNGEASTGGVGAVTRDDLLRDRPPRG